METIERLTALIRDARASCQGMVLSAHERDSRMALYLIAHGVDIPVRCEECMFCKEDGLMRLKCLHPNRRNPTGCWETDYCDAGVRRSEDE